jgi:P27 family predicted phage terminase small subunit
MGNLGRPPLPSNLKLVRGTARAKRLNSNEPDVRPAIPTCPTHLNDTAKSEWRRVTKLLLPLGLITKLDRACLGAYCAAYSTWVEACEQIERYGLGFKSPTGFPLQSPYVAIRDRALDQIRTFGSEFGMSPSARSRVKTTNPRQRNLFEEFLDGEEEQV